MSFVFFWLSLFKLFLLFVLLSTLCMSFLLVCSFVSSGIFALFLKLKYFIFKIKIYHAHVDLKKYLWNIHFKKKF